MSQVEQDIFSEFRELAKFTENIKNFEKECKGSQNFPLPNFLSAFHEFIVTSPHFKLLGVLHPSTFFQKF